MSNMNDKKASVPDNSKQPIPEFDPSSEKTSLEQITLWLTKTYHSGDYSNPNIAKYLTPNFRVYGQSHPRGYIPEMAKRQMDLEACRKEIESQPHYQPKGESATAEVFPKTLEPDEKGGKKEVQYAVVWVTLETEGDLERVFWREVVTQCFWRKEEGRWRMWMTEAMTGMACGV